MAYKYAFFVIKLFFPFWSKHGKKIYFDNRLFYKKHSIDLSKWFMYVILFTRLPSKDNALYY